MLLSEIDWLKDQPQMIQAGYLAADRRGRGFGLNTDQRQKMWAAIESYQRILDQQGALDWGRCASDALAVCRG